MVRARWYLVSAAALAIFVPTVVGSASLSFTGAPESPAPASPASLASGITAGHSAYAVLDAGTPPVAALSPPEFGLVDCVRHVGPISIPLGPGDCPGTVVVATPSALVQGGAASGPRSRWVATGNIRSVASGGKVWTTSEYAFTTDAGTPGTAYETTTGPSVEGPDGTVFNFLLAFPASAPPGSYVVSVAAS
jgi:hypothetical protein